MSCSTNEDREHSVTTNMEESHLNTIEFLRARLLSERSVSKTARQRADELAKRVAELEEQLKFVSLQRKKAEKATVDVLAILENHGISDVSEEFDSCSEQGDCLEDYTAPNGSLKETSTYVKLRKHEKEAYSSSEVESSPSTGRSLSWKSTKDSQHSLEKKKYMESVRRRASFSSNSSSARRVGKSCRRIRRRETRSMDESHNDVTENAAYSRDASNCSDGEHVALAETSGYANGEGPLEGTLGPISGTQKVNGHYIGIHDKDENMESALQHQEQLIGQFEEEEKAQREWEEKFRENNGATQDSCDPGNHSDITEERYETKSQELSCAVGTTDSNNREMKQGPVDTPVNEEPQTSKSSTPVTDADKGHLQDEKRSSAIDAHNSSASEFSFPMSKKSYHEFSRKQHEGLTHGMIPLSYVEKSIALSTSSGGPSSFELAVVPQETSSGLGSVLGALQQAKLSLNQKLSSLPQAEGGTSGDVNPYTETSRVDSFQIPYTIPGIFRLPTDYHFEATARANPGNGVQSSFADYHPEIANGRFLSEPFVESRSAFSGDAFLTVPNRPFNPEMRPGVPPQRSLSLSQPRLSEAPAPSNRMNQLDPYRNPVLPPVQDSYPFPPDATLRSPLNKEGASRTFPISERGLPPVMRLSSYDGRGGPNTYR